MHQDHPYYANASKSVQKAMRAEDAAQAKVSDVLERVAAGDPLVYDEHFWRSGAWDRIVDRAGQTVEDTINAERRERGDPPLAKEQWYIDWMRDFERFVA